MITTVTFSIVAVTLLTAWAVRKIASMAQPAEERASSR
jgi:hypothetical protein